jgi:hypothetical protein
MIPQRFNFIVVVPPTHPRCLGARLPDQTACLPRLFRAEVRPPGISHAAGILRVDVEAEIPD